MAATVDVRMKQKATKDKATADEKVKERARIYDVLFNTKSSAHREFPAAKTPVRLEHTSPAAPFNPGQEWPKPADRGGPQEHLDVMADREG